MGDALIITGIIQFIMVIIFIVMAANIGRTKSEIIKIGKVIEAWSRETGTGRSKRRQLGEFARVFLPEKAPGANHGRS